MNLYLISTVTILINGLIFALGRLPKNWKVRKVFQTIFMFTFPTLIAMGIYALTLFVTDNPYM